MRVGLLRAGAGERSIVLCNHGMKRMEKMKMGSRV